MASKNKPAENKTTQQGTQDSVTAPQGNEPTMTFNRLYVKDIEFKGLDLLHKIKEEIKTDLNYNINTAQVATGIHEVSLSVVAQFNSAKEKIVTLQVSYGALYQLNNIPEDRQEGALVAEGGRVMYPYVQRLVADIVRESGLPAFQLPPVDFFQFYQQSKKQNLEK